MEVHTLDPEVRKKVERFLYLGIDDPKYFPGCWQSHKYYEMNKSQCINEAFTEDKDNLEIVKMIHKAHLDGWITHPEIIPFALTKCLKFGGPAVREEVYKLAPQVLKSSEQLMQFTKFTRIHKTGSGHGWCNALRKWYSNKDPLDLAKEISRVKSRHSHSHRTLIMKSHIKVEEADVCRDAVVKYGVFGLKKAKAMMANKPEASRVFEYIQVVEDMRHCEDPTHAWDIATQNKLTLDHVPGHLLTSPDVWAAVIPQMTLEELLGYLLRIHNMGFFSAMETENDITTIVVSMLTNKELIQKSKLTPIGVYIAICNYRKKNRPMKYQKSKIFFEKERRRRAKQILDPETGVWKWTVKRRNPKEIKIWGIEQPPNENILTALNSLLDETWLLTPATGARYMITLDMRCHMFKGRHFAKKYGPFKKAKKAAPCQNQSAIDDCAVDDKDSKRRLCSECFYNTNVTPGYAAIVMTLHILKREKNVKLAVFTEDGVRIVEIEPHFSTINETLFVLRKLELGRVQQHAPLDWANKNNEKIDVFINMVDRTTRYNELETDARGGLGPGGVHGPPPAPHKNIADHSPERAMLRYREQQNMPNSKLIVMSLGSKRVNTTDGTQSGFLDIVGIDEHVVKVMDAFVKGYFH